MFVVRPVGVRQHLGRPFRTCEKPLKLHRTCGIVKGFRMKRAISASQCRAARGLLNISRDRLAEISGVPSRTIADLELENATPRASTAERLLAALEAAGVEFIPENGGGPGVRLRKR